MIYPRYKIYNQQIFKSFFKKKISIDELENKFIKYTNLKNIIFLNFARVGLFYAIKKILSDNRKEILLSPFTIFDVVNMIICAGGVPKFIDTNLNSPHISKKNISEHYSKNTAGVLITHYHNINPEIEEIINFCNSKNIKTIEDCAISLGGKYKNSSFSIGSKSDYAIYSFGIFKTISTISGGALYVKSNAEYNKIKNEVKLQKSSYTNLFFKLFNKLKFQTFLNKIFFNIFFFHLIKFSELYKIKNLNKYLKNDPDPKKIKNLPKKYLDKISDYQIKEIFFQLDKYPAFIDQRLKNALIIEKNLKNNNNLILPNLDYRTDTFHSYPVLIKNSQKENLYNFLLKNNFDVSKYYYRNCSSLFEFSEYGSNCINSEFYSNNVLNIPCYPELREDYLEKLCLKINNYFINEN